MKATLKLPQYSDRAFDATITTTSQAIDAKSRSLLVELSANNNDGALQPGAFAEVHFQIPTSADTLRLPASAMIFRNQSAEVATVGADNRIVMKKVEIGRDLGTEVEIGSGLSAGDRVVANPPELDRRRRPGAYSLPDRRRAPGRRQRRGVIARDQRRGGRRSCRPRGDILNEGAGPCWRRPRHC